MQNRSWEYALVAILLLGCLLIGLGISQLLAPKPIIGVIRFESVITFESAERLIELAEAARQDDQVAGVVLEIFSPGGLATSSESAFYSLLQLREEKPLVTVVDGLAVSGGYYMAVAGNRIYAPASSYVANVGTRGSQPTDPEASPGELSSGPYKIAGGARFDRIRQLDLVKAAFVGNVVHQRSNAAENPLGISAETVAEARIYLGSEAVAVGLVDYEGSRSDGILAAAELAGVRNYRIANLEEYFGISIVPPPPTPQPVQALFAEAPPDSVFLLDSRLPLPSLMDDSDLDSHLLRLRNIDPGSLSANQLWRDPAAAPSADQSASDAITPGE